VALNQHLSATATTPTVVPGTGAFSFLVSDTGGPTVTKFHPPAGSTDNAQSTSITITFNEAVQAGTGSVTLIESNGITRHLAVSDAHHVQVSGSTVTINPWRWFQPGTVTVRMPSGVITDDPHAASPTPNPFAGLTDDTYQFSVSATPPGTAPGTVSIGSGSGPTSCTYIMKEYHCFNFEECAVFVKPMNPSCEGHATHPTQMRKITFKAQQKIASHAFQRDGSDGGGTLLTYAGGRSWPEIGVADMD